MVQYPIHVERHPYRGSNPQKLRKRDDYNRDAAHLEKLVNKLIEDRGPGVYLYYQIALEAGLSTERVREILFSVACGSNGFTVSRGVNGEPAEFIKRLAEGDGGNAP